MQKWKFYRDGVAEDVELERWAWMVDYNNGSALVQFDADGLFHQIGEVKQDEAVLFSMFKPLDPSKRITILLPKGTKIIHKYRNIKRADETEWERIYMFGYKDGESYFYHFILPDDRVIVSNNDDIDLTRFI